MEIKLKQEDLTGTPYYEHWKELRDIFLTRSDQREIILAAVCDQLKLNYHSMRNGTREYDYGKGRQIYCGIMRCLMPNTNRGYDGIMEKINRGRATIYNTLMRFEQYYKLYKNYREDVHSVVVKLPIEQQEKIHKYLKKLR